MLLIKGIILPWLLVEIDVLALINLNNISNPFLHPLLTSWQHNMSLDFWKIQRTVKDISFNHTLAVLYEDCLPGSTSLADFRGRTDVGIRQVLVSTGINTEIQYIKYGNNTGNCLITTAALRKGVSRTRKLIHQLKHQLHVLKFDGLFIFMVGGYPISSSRVEIKYIAVPYAFKVFMFTIARENGCGNVLWIDSHLFPINDLTPIFDTIQYNGALLNLNAGAVNFNWKFIFPSTRKFLHSLSGVDVANVSHVVSIILGLNVKDSLVQNAMREFYKYTELGTPFLSCFPEEFVFNAIFHQPSYESLKVLEKELQWKLFHPVHAKFGGKNHLEPEVEYLRNLGYYFAYVGRSRESILPKNSSVS